MIDFGLVLYSVSDKIMRHSVEADLHEAKRFERNPKEDKALDENDLTLTPSVL